MANGRLGSIGFVLRLPTNAKTLAGSRRVAHAVRTETCCAKVKKGTQFQDRGVGRKTVGGLGGDKVARERFPTLAF